MASKDVKMRADPAFRDLLKKKSEETGLSVIDITRIIGRQNPDIFFIPHKKGKKKLKIVEDEDFFNMFK